KAPIPEWIGSADESYGRPCLPQTEAAGERPAQPRSAATAPAGPGPSRDLLPPARPRQDRTALRVPLPRLERERSVGGRAWQPRRRRDAAGGAALAPPPWRTDRADTADIRAVRVRVARKADRTAPHARDLQLGAHAAPAPPLRPAPPRPAQRRRRCWPYRPNRRPHN